MSVILDDMSLVIGSHNISATIESGELSFGVEPKDNTTMGANTRKSMAGLKNWSIRATVHQDWAASGLDEDMFLVIGTTQTIVLKPASNAITSSNPGYTGLGLVAQWDPIVGGQVGEIAKANVVILAAGDLDRDVTS